MSDEIKLSKRVTLDFTGRYEDKARDPSYAWLDEWEEEYRIVKDLFYNVEEQHFDLGFPVRFDILCSEKAFNALPKNALNEDTEWVKEGIIIDSRKNRKEEFEFERAGEPDTLGEALKKPLTFNKTEQSN